ncbi:tumor necrosis factor receptor superfamily member 14-like [Talpa occidentalis]|uniref:tumor necrosis factor receptor superfamily member 14-like n=1 Tax=Talpa occidentalis TaxID=50954 RepID=UPI0018902D8B|nr:tumor necrosis factor receptor superfamily member 14-like [Talpa occidentalis]
MGGPGTGRGAPPAPGTLPRPRPAGPKGWAALTLVLILGLLLISLLQGIDLPPCTEEQYQVGARCCPKCSPGERVKQACGANTGTSCVPCAPGTYMDKLNDLRECLPCRDCRPALGLVTRRGCSPTGDAVCGCAPGHVCVQVHGDSCAQCRPHTACRPGQSVRQRGTERQDTLCEDCPPGTFSPDGTLEQCRPWTRCSWLEAEANPGTSSSDVTCASRRLYLLLLLLVLFVVSSAVAISTCVR